MAKAITKAQAQHGITEIISERVWNASQTWHYELVALMKQAPLFSGFAHRVRVSIEHNAYAEQSIAKVEHFDNGRWEYVHSIPGVELDRYCYTNRQAPVVSKVFAKDAAELLRVARAVLP